LEKRSNDYIVVTYTSLHQGGVIRMEIEYIFIGAAISIVSLTLLLVSVYSYHIYRNSKLLFVIFVFIFFLIRGLLLSIGLFYDPLWPIVNDYYVWIFDLLILTMLYMAALKR